MMPFPVILTTESPSAVALAFVVVLLLVIAFAFDRHPERRRQT
jgi:hypothetical protein